MVSALRWSRKYFLGCIRVFVFDICFDFSAPWVQRMAHRLRSNSSQKLYFSFGHDITILPVLTALGLFPGSAFTPLGTDAIDWYRSFRGGSHVPFCANLVVEKLRCKEADYVRVLNNQVPGTAFQSRVNDSSSRRLWKRSVGILRWIV